MLRVAVIGVGNIGNIHAPNYKSDPLSELVAVCDIIPERADKAAAKYGVRAFYSVEDMLRHEQLDAVSICTAGAENGGDHFTPTMECLEAGLHVLGEKPISNDIAKARQMVAKADEKGVPYGINLNHRFMPAGRQRQAVGDGRAAGRPAAHQHDDVDQQPQRDLAVVPPARPAPALARRHALLLR